MELARIFCFGVLASAFPVKGMACSACLGAAGANMTRGMNMGILSLLGVVTAVLIGFGAFFLQLARRSRRASAS